MQKAQLNLQKRLINLMSNILLMVKHCALSHTGEILWYFDKKGKRYKTSLIERVPPNLIIDHYSHCIGEKYFFPMIQDMQEKSAVIALYSNANIKEFVKTKRCVNLEFAYVAGVCKGYKRTSVHTSDSPKAFNRECRIWAPYL